MPAISTNLNTTTQRERVGKFLAAKRKRSGINQKQLAVQARTTQTTVSEIENGKANFTLCLYDRIVRELKIEPPVPFFYADVFKDDSPYDHLSKIGNEDTLQPLVCKWLISIVKQSELPQSEKDKTVLELSRVALSPFGIVDKDTPAETVINIMKLFTSNS